jgi:hypothetical protein
VGPGLVKSRPNFVPRIRSADTGAIASNTNCVGEIVGEAAAFRVLNREVSADLLFLSSPNQY